MEAMGFDPPVSLPRSLITWRLRPIITAVTITLLLVSLSCAQTATPAPAAPTLSQHVPGAAGVPTAPSAGRAMPLFQKLAATPLDPEKVFHIRDCDLDFEDLHITLEEGTVAFTQPVDGRVTGALFSGDGLALVIPPNEVERSSLIRFTKTTVLNENFRLAYIRFNDPATEKTLASCLRAPEPNAAELVARWNALAKSFAAADALRLTVSMLNSGLRGGDRFLHARIAGEKLGTFDAFYDQSAQEAISVAQLVPNGDATYYDQWLSFPSRSQRAAESRSQPQRKARSNDEPITQTDLRQPEESGVLSLLEPSEFKLDVELTPPSDLKATADIRFRATRAGVASALLLLSRNLKVSSAALDGEAIEFLQNPAIAGSETARRGDDLLVLVFPQPLGEAETHTISIQYSGPVMSDSGGGLLYVGERGTWYPNVGMHDAQYGMTFRYPAGWSMVATGDTPVTTSNGDTQVTQVKTSRPVPVVGFNLGHFQERTAPIAGGKAMVSAFAANKIELGATLDPTKDLQQIADRAAAVIDFLQARVGPYPYSRLAVTQTPGDVNQGWPELVYLTSKGFIAGAPQVHFGEEYYRVAYQDLLLAHETAHQFWGDNVGWRSYREQWISEALANYTAAVFLDEKVKPGDLQTILQHARDELLGSTQPAAKPAEQRSRPSLQTGVAPETSATQPPATSSVAQQPEPPYEAGPVTLGQRLNSSKLPNAYNIVTYDRGTWLIHMLHTMMRDAALLEGRSQAAADALFWQALANIQSHYGGGVVGTADIEREFEAVTPPSLRYENSASLDWFFSGWVNGTVIPRFEFADVVIAKDGTAKGTIRSTETSRDLVTALPIYAQSADGAQTLVAQVFADDPESDFTIKVPAGTVRLLLDPKHEVLRRE